MSKPALFPDRVSVQLSGPAPAGLAVCLIFPMRSKNPFFYTLFADNSGRAEVSGADLLAFFDKARQEFSTEYLDPRTEFGGTVLAEILGVTELESSREALEMFRGRFPYPARYEENLTIAIGRGGEADLHEVLSVDY